MGQAPRLPEVRLPWEKRIIYFVTFCVQDRRKVPANSRTFEAIKTAIAQLRKWHVLAAVIMPDHDYLIVRPSKIESFLSVISQAASNECVERSCVLNRGNGSVVVVIGFFARTTTCITNGFTCRTTLCGTV